MKKLIKYNFFVQLVAEAYTRGIGTIFMLHRVENVRYPKLTPNEDLKVSPDYLAQVIGILRKKGYSFISLDELTAILTQGKSAKKVIVFTLDDGYRDNLTQALPVFSSENVPFVVYITTCFPEQTADLWWYNLEQLVTKHERLVFTDGSHFISQTPEEKWKAFMAIRANVLQGKITRAEIQTQTPQATEGLCMSWEEIQQLADNPWVTIGAHTLNHPALRTLPYAEAAYEMEQSKNELEKKLKRKITHFAYPFGERQQAGEREFALAHEIGFYTAVTTRAGNIFPAHKNFLTALPRIYLYENAHKLSNQMFIEVFWSNKFKRIVTI